MGSKVSTKMAAPTARVIQVMFSPVLVIALDVRVSSLDWCCSVGRGSLLLLLWSVPVFFCGALLGDSGRCTLVGVLVKQQNSESCRVFSSAGTTVECPERCSQPDVTVPCHIRLSLLIVGVWFDWDVGDWLKPRADSHSCWIELNGTVKYTDWLKQIWPWFFTFTFQMIGEY